MTERTEYNDLKPPVMVGGGLEGVISFKSWNKKRRYYGKKI